MAPLILILSIVLIIWFWLDSARAKEIATEVSTEACRLRGVQFLDQTVALRRIMPRWTAQGIRLRRTYLFDYSDQGLERHTGRIILIGTELEEFSLGLF